jgi:aquaporin Z
MKKYIVEFIGAFFLLFVIGLTVINPGAGPLAPIAIGTTLMVMVYAGGYISGGHFNPAVTLAVWMRGKCETKDVPWYMVAQFLGGVLAALLTLFIKRSAGAQITAAVPAVVPALIAEALFTFALCYVVLHTATSKGTAGNSYYGLAIGFTLMAAAYAIGNISGCAINPAVALGVTIMGLIKVTSIWIYLVANFLGGAAAAIVYKAVSSES